MASPDFSCRWEREEDEPKPEDGDCDHRHLAPVEAETACAVLRETIGVLERGDDTHASLQRLRLLLHALEGPRA